MPKIRPFKAVRYNKSLIKDLSRVIAPPYDIIPPKLQDELYRKHENNIVRLILGKIKRSDNAHDNRYTRAAALLKSWLKTGVLIQDKKPAIYIYTQSYRHGGGKINRFGFMARMGLDLGRKTKILPHENTLLAPKLDRLSLTRATKSNLSPIFVLYEDKGKKVGSALRSFISGKRPAIDVNFEGVNNKVWVLDEPKLIKRIEKLLGKDDVFIADGHHRYEVARMYAREIGKKDVPAPEKESAKYTIAYFVESDERSLTILPTHRAAKDIEGLSRGEALSRLEEFFTVQKASSLSNMMSKLGKLSGEHAFGIPAAKTFMYCGLRT